MRKTRRKMCCVRNNIDSECSVENLFYFFCVRSLLLVMLSMGLHIRGASSPHVTEKNTLSTPTDMPSSMMAEPTFKTTTTTHLAHNTHNIIEKYTNTCNAFAISIMQTRKTCSKRRSGNVGERRTKPKSSEIRTTIRTSIHSAE